MAILRANEPALRTGWGLGRAGVNLAGFSLFISLLMLTGPLYMLQVYDRVLASQSVPTLVALTLLIAGLYAALAMLDWVRSGILSATASNFEGRLATAALDATLAAKVADPGEVSDNSLRDLRMIRRFIAGPALKAAFDAPFAILFFALLFLIHWAYGTLAVAGAVVLAALAAMNRILTRKKTLEAEQLEQAALARSREMTRNAEIIAALGMARSLKAKWRDEFDRSDAAMVSSGDRNGSFSAWSRSFRLLLQSAVLGLGAYLSIRGLSTPGAMVAASIIAGRAVAPLEQLVGQWRSVTLAREAWISLRRTLDIPAGNPAATELPAIAGRLAFEQVSAGPPGARKPVLANIDFEIAPGTVLGVIGPSAAGKSTLGRLSIGLWRPQAGTVRIDGADVSAWPRDTLGPQIGYLPQEVDLFSGTVRDNIGRFAPDVPDSAIIAAAQAADCHGMILRLPDGYDTQIGSAGAYLSAGQRQRIGLARAMFGEPALVVLDEPNANLDHAGDVALQAAIAGLRTRGATVIIIAHRPNAIIHCTKLLMLDGGEQRAFGDRDEVLAGISPRQAVGSRISVVGRGDAHD